MKSHCLGNITTSLFSCMAIATLFSLLFIFYHTNNFIQPNQGIYINPIKIFYAEVETCDLFEGKWIPDPTGPLYTNHSCKTVPFLRNCFLHGRKDRDFLHWRWKPHKCELPRFDPKTFLSILRGKKMVFIGDSLARNQMESLLCLLSTVETPKSIEKDAEDKSTRWDFPDHKFTLASIWSPFLVAAAPRLVNGTDTGGFHLHLDRVDPKWSEDLPSIDYAVFSDAHWFFRPNYLYENNNLIGCIYCQDANVAAVDLGRAIEKAFRAAFKSINECKTCKKIVTFLRTYSPAHFEGGSWDGGGGCNRTRPIGREEVDEAAVEWKYRRVQVEEVAAASREGEGRNEFEVLDVTEMMVVRADGHPGVYWGNQWMKGYNDCVHWCMPGPIDTWNELLLERIKTRNGELSRVRELDLTLKS